MTISMKFIFCDNEHGTGDVCFPSVDGDPHSVRQAIVDGQHQTLRGLRAEARKAGWSRSGGVDYCPHCTESNSQS